MDKTKIAILGGGIGSVATAFRLTATSELRAKYDVTIYQIGWRIGGKGASGRNPDPKFGYRIEEHGLHIWFGFYDNAFRMMRDCYQELARDPSLPLSTFEQAFRPADSFVVYENYNGRWVPRLFKAPRNNREPGNLQRVPEFWEIAENTLRWFLSLWADTTRSSAAASAPMASLSLSREGLRLAAELGLDVRHVISIGPEGLLRVAYELAAACAGGATAIIDPFPLVSMLLREFRDWLWNDWAKHHVDDDTIRFLFTTFDLLTTILEGILKDDVLGKGLSSVNDEDFVEWLTRHGAEQITLATSVFVRMPYSAAFAFLDGDIEQGNLAAGVGLSVLLWSLFTYSGALFFKMQAGMGDTVFAPFYQVLLRRGVTFKFFHAVDKLHISGGLINSIEMTEQVKLKVPRYKPLVDVKKLPCWPNEPLWDQIEGGDELKHDCVDLETDHSLKGSEQKTLYLGKDFNIVVLGISVEALKDICGELYQDDPKFRAMIDHSRTTMTQAFQLWLNKDVKSLGWGFGNQFIMSTYVEPLDTWADMSQLITTEDWSPDDNVESIQYFCGVIEDLDTNPPEDQKDVTARAKRNAIDYLEDDVGVLWPFAMKRGHFDWNILVDPYLRRGKRRFDSQFWRANFAKTERYVLSPAGSIKFRLKTNGTKYTNLFLAGDWTDCGGNAGCVECAVTSGMLAARAIKGSHEPILREDDKWLAPKSRTLAGSLLGGTMTAVSITEKGASEVVAAGIEFVKKVYLPPTPSSSLGFVDIMRRLLGDARQAFDLGLNTALWAADNMAAIAKATPLPPGPIQQTPVRRKVVILGGGVAGMSAAHELAVRGFEVEVYESGDIPGGKARSFEIPNTGKNGRKNLPAEHGFRFFPGFYRHIIDTMQHIPYGRGRTVKDNLTPAKHVAFASQLYSMIVAPAEFPTSWDELVEALDSVIKIVSNVPPLDSLWFINRLLVMATSCDGRREKCFENQSWMEFTDAKERSAAFCKFYVVGMTRCAVACQAELISATTAATFTLQLMFKLATPGEQVDRVLNGPTNEVWLDPWRSYLEAMGVKYFTSQRLDRFVCGNKHLNGVVIKDKNGLESVITADYYISAIPADKINELHLITPAMINIDSGLEGIGHLKCDWMNGTQFYLTQPPRLPQGHVVYFDSRWALTSVSQESFWSRPISETYGDGTVNAILSIDISDWLHTRGLNGKLASVCTRNEIEDEIIAQINGHVGLVPGPILDGTKVKGWILDPDIIITQNNPTRNLEPLLINVKGTRKYRPGAVTRIPNLFLASDYVRTFTDLATMEGANEAARCAVNGILDSAGHPPGDRCAVWPLEEPDLLAPLRLLDQVLFDSGLPNPLDMPFARLISDGGANWLEKWIVDMTIDFEERSSRDGTRDKAKALEKAVRDTFGVVVGVQSALVSRIQWRGDE